MRRLVFLAAIAIAIPGSQIGHALAYALRFGSSAAVLQRTGAHTYFPTTFSISSALLAAAIVSALLVIGAARVLLGRHSRARFAPRVSLPVLITLAVGLQLAAYIVQETVEATVIGQAPPGISTVLLWGLAGQLPVGIASAVALYWLSLRIDHALTDLWFAAQRYSIAPVACGRVAIADFPTHSRAMSSHPRQAHHGRAPPRP